MDIYRPTVGYKNKSAIHSGNWKCTMYIVHVFSSLSWPKFEICIFASPTQISKTTKSNFSRSISSTVNPKQWPNFFALQKIFCFVFRYFCCCADWVCWHQIYSILLMKAQRIQTVAMYNEYAKISFQKFILKKKRKKLKWMKLVSLCRHTNYFFSSFHFSQYIYIFVRP